jgi:hypothetical protein
MPVTRFCTIEQHPRCTASIFFAAQLSGLLGADLGVGGVDFTRIPPFLKLPLENQLSVFRFPFFLLLCNFIMSSFNIVVLGGDHCGPEVRSFAILTPHILPRVPRILFES